MTTTYRVEQDGVTVFESESKKYNRSIVPAEWWARPEQGEVRIYVDDELISVAVPITKADRQRVEKQRALEAIVDPTLKVK